MGHSSKKVKYEISPWGNEYAIREIEIISETPHFITYLDEWWEGYRNKRRVRKRSGWKHYYDTWDEAYQALEERAEKRVKNAEQNLKEALYFRAKLMEYRETHEKHVSVRTPQT